MSNFVSEFLISDFDIWCVPNALYMDKKILPAQYKTAAATASDHYRFSFHDSEESVFNTSVPLCSRPAHASLPRRACSS
jgi:hypothetical protein